jgi:hypothetical protein
MHMHAHSLKWTEQEEITKMAYGWARVRDYVYVGEVRENTHGSSQCKHDVSGQFDAHNR